MKFILRKWMMSDAPSLALYANNRNIAQNLRDVFPYPYTLKDAQEFITEALQSDISKNLLRAIEVNGKAVGSIGVFVKDDIYSKTAEIGYWLGEPFWGNGIVSRAIEEMSHTAFEQLDIVRLYAEPFAINHGSRRALEKAGYQLEGILSKNIFKLGEVLDSCIYAKLKEKEE